MPCLFVVEWGVRVQQAVRKRRTAAYLLSGRGLLDTAMPSPCPRLAPGGDPHAAWLSAITWGPQGDPRQVDLPGKKVRLGESAFFGETALGNSLRSANISTIRLSKLLLLDLVDFRVLTARHPDLAQGIDAETQRRAMENRT